MTCFKRGFWLNDRKETNDCKMQNGIVNVRFSDKMLSTKKLITKSIEHINKQTK